MAKKKGNIFQQFLGNKAKYPPPYQKFITSIFYPALKVLMGLGMPGGKIEIEISEKSIEWFASCMYPVAVKYVRSSKSLGLG